MQRIFFFFLLLPFLSTAQFFDDFSDGDFTNNPAWTGDVQDWQVLNEQLNSNGPAVTGTQLILATPSALALDATWEFFVNPALATSSGNFADVFVISDSDVLNGANNGYFIRIGGTPDEVSLFLKSGGTSTKIIDGVDGIIASSSNNPAFVKLTRDASGLFTLYADTGGTGTNYQLQGTVTENSIITSNYFGILVNYSSANAQNFFFDDFTVFPLVPDVTPPGVDTIYAVNPLSIRIDFNEPLSLTTAEVASNYFFDNGIGTPVSAQLDISDPSLVHLVVATGLTGGTTYTVTVTGVEDLAGNAANLQVSFTFVADTLSPVIAALSVVNLNQLDVMFSEPVMPASAENENYYIVDNGIGFPSSAILDASDPTLVHLIFAASFSPGVQYTITIDSLSDLSGNIMLGEFEFFSITAILPGDIVINEIMADPDPVVGLPAFEYVELFNRTQSFVNLNNWTITIGTTVRTFGNVTLLPDSFLIVTTAAGAADLQAFGPVAPVFTSATTLTNAGTSITLKDTAGVVINSVTYSDTWYQDNDKDDGGWSLELINPQNPCSGSNNWSASEDPFGGTPGRTNSIHATEVDSIAPVVSSVSVTDVNLVGICFNEPLDTVLVANLSNYSADNGLGAPVSISFSGFPVQCFTLEFSQPFDTGTIYTITISGISDCLGNVVLTPVTSNFVIGLPAIPGDIVINEIMADPDPQVGLPNAEYLELYNRSSSPINLTGWTIEVGSTVKAFPAFDLMPDEYILITSEANQLVFEQYGKVLPLFTSGTTLTNSGTAINLKNSTGTIINSVTYSDTWYRDADKKNGGWSLELLNPYHPCSGATNWSASTDESGGTPGRQNSMFTTDVETDAPAVLRAIVLNPGEVKLFFTKAMDLPSVLNPANYVINQGIGNPVGVQEIAGDNSVVILQVSPPIQQGIIYTVTVSGNVTDCVGNVLGAPNSARFAIPESMVPGDLIINEILFNPYTGGNDFVELYNRTDKPLDLINAKIANGNQSSSTVKVITSENFLVLPGDYVVLTGNPDGVTSFYSTPGEHVFITISSFPSFVNEAGHVIIFDHLNNVVDEFNYSSGMHFPLLNDVKGVSLERIDFNRPTQDVTNWHSAAETVGFATPGYKNSQYQPAEGDGNEFTITPEIFSPDNDGYNDVVHFQYHLDLPGYVATVKIFDSRGRLIRNLLNNHLLATEGVFSWDGINDNNEKARIGIYIALVQFFNSNGATKEYKLTCVLATKF